MLLLLMTYLATTGWTHKTLGFLVPGKSLVVFVVFPIKWFSIFRLLIAHR